MLIRTFKQQNPLTCTQLDNIYSTQMGNRRMRTRMYGGVRGRKTKVGRKLLLFFLLLDCMDNMLFNNFAV